MRTHLVTALGVWAWQPADLAAQSQSTRKVSAATKSSGASARRGHGIAVVVNDEAITGYQIEQRARFLGVSANVGDEAKANFQRLVKSPKTEAQLRALQQEVISSNPGKTREEPIAIFQKRQQQFGMSLQKQALQSARAAMVPKFKTEAQKELIDERLKVQAAKKHGIVVSDDEVKRLIKGLADRNQMSYDAFARHLGGMGINIDTMAEKFRAQKAWQQLVGRRWGAQVSVSQLDVDQLLSTAAAQAGKQTVELQVQKLSLTLPGKANQAALTKRVAEADALRRRLSGCKGMAALAKDVRDAKFQDMKYIKPAAIAEPTRSMLLSAKDDDVLPPIATSAGVEIYAVCGRRVVAGNDAQRRAAMAELQSKQLDLLSRRHRRNLRQEANIEYK